MRFKCKKLCVCVSYHPKYTVLVVFAVKCVLKYVVKISREVWLNDLICFSDSNLREVIRIGSIFALQSFRNLINFGKANVSVFFLNDSMNRDTLCIYFGIFCVFRINVYAGYEVFVL